jgi:hypothetical protein
MTSTSSVDCSAVGCGAPPICPNACDAPCGCCGCGARGTVQVMNGVVYECQGECWAALDGSSCDVPECFAPINCVERCGGPVVYGSCCPCPGSLIEETQCGDAGA